MASDLVGSPVRGHVPVWDSLVPVSCDGTDRTEVAEVSPWGPLVLSPHGGAVAGVGGGGLVFPVLWPGAIFSLGVCGSSGAVLSK